MKKLILTTILASLFVLANSQTYTLDATLSSATWIGYGEIGSFKQEGSIDLKKGNIYLDNTDVKSGTIIFNSKSISHENKELRKHLKAKDFFHSKKYPEIIFEIKETQGNLVSGTLSIRGKSNDETFTFEKIEKEGFLIFAGRASFDRTKYDIKYNSSSYFQDLGNYAIKNDIDLEFRLIFKEKL